MHRDGGFSDGDDPIDRIEAALGALRRGPRGPWGGPHPHGPGHGHGQEPRFIGHWSGGREARGDADVGDGPGPWGMPPWAGRGPHGRGGWESRFGQAARFRLLATLEASEHPMSVTELAAAIGVDQPRASRLVQAAVEEGSAVREADPADARRTRVRLTDDGRRLIASTRSSRRGLLESALADFTPDERAQFAALLAKFVRGLRGDAR